VNIRKLDLGRSNRALNAVEARIRRLIKTAQTSERDAAWERIWRRILDYLRKNPMTVGSVRKYLNWLKLTPEEYQAVTNFFDQYEPEQLIDEKIIDSAVDFLRQNERIKHKLVLTLERVPDAVMPQKTRYFLIDVLEWRLDKLRRQQNRPQTAQQDMLQPGPSQPQPAQDVEKRLQLIMRDFDKYYYYDPVRSCYWLRYRNGPWIGFVPAVPASSRRFTVVEDSKHGATYLDNATGYHWVQLPNDQWYIVSLPMRQPSYTQFDPQKALEAPPAKQSPQPSIPKPTQPNIQQPVLTQPK